MRPRFIKITIPEKRYHCREEINGKRIIGQFHFYQRAMKYIRKLNALNIKAYLAKVSKQNGLFYVLEDLN